MIGAILARLPESNRFERIWKLALVDFKRRYYNDKLGLIWALLHPLLRIGTYYFIFKFVFQRGEENYGVFLFSGIVIWMFFMETTKSGMNLFRRKRYLLESVQLNKIDLFLSHTVAVFLGFSFNLLSFFVIATISGIDWTWQVLWLPLLILNTLVLSFGACLILAILNLYFNDIIHAWDILMLFGFWTAGIFFKAEDILNVAPWMGWVHPFLGIIENTRNVTMYGSGLDVHFFVLNWVYSFLVLAVGLVMFYGYRHTILERL